MAKLSTSSAAAEVDHYRATHRFGSLDGLRFVCIAAVLWHHAPIWREAELRILERGFVGVDFFFVLSGFLITTLLLRERRTRGQFSLRKFYWRRMLRILPVYFLVVTLICAYYILWEGEERYLPYVPFYYLFLSNFLIADLPMLAPTWSLSVEEQYYLIWPMLLMLVPHRLLLPLLAGLMALNVAAISGMLTPLGITAFVAGPLKFAMFNATYVPILLGSALAIVLESRQGFAVLAPLAKHRMSPALAFMALLILLQILPDDLRGWPNLVMHFTMAACLTTLVVREDNLLRPIFSWPPFVRMGEISYGIYLYHLIALHIATIILGRIGVGTEGLAITLLYVALSVLIAEISFQYFESWFLRLKQRGLGQVAGGPPLAAESR